MELLLGCVASYLLGSLPFALLLVRWLAGVDLRRVGSGNLGATNASRAFGKGARLPVFLLIYLLDFAKGWLPVHFGPQLLSLDNPTASAVLMGACAILGHCFSLFLRFSGGKGVATTTGVFAALDLTTFLAALAVFFLVLGLSRKVFLGSLALGLTLVAGSLVRHLQGNGGDHIPVLLLSVLVAGFLFYTHRSNLRQWWS